MLLEAPVSLSLREQQEGSTVRQQWQDCGRSSQAAFSEIWNQRVLSSTFR